LQKVVKAVFEVPAANLDFVTDMFKANDKLKKPEKEEGEEFDAYKVALKKAVSDRHPIHWHWIASDMYHLANVFAVSLNLITRMDGDLMPTIVVASTSLLESATKLAKVDMDADGVDKDVWLGKYATGMSESMIWVLGKLAKSLMHISKKDEEKKTDEEKKEDEQDKKKKELAERKAVLQLMMQSNVLSGGLDLESVGLLKPESKSQLRKYAQLCGDTNMLKALRKAAPEQSPLYAVINKGTDAGVD
jgi:hypothetical protein